MNKKRNSHEKFPAKPIAHHPIILHTQADSCLPLKYSKSIWSQPAFVMSKLLLTSGRQN